MSNFSTPSTFFIFVLANMKQGLNFLVKVMNHFLPYQINNYKIILLQELQNRLIFFFKVTIH